MKHFKMATSRKNLSASDGQEEFFDWRCGVCEENKELMKEARAYCKNCGEGLCESCLPFHNKYNKKHSVLGPEEKAKWGEAEVPAGTSSLPECSEHEGQSISMYCGRHDDLCCPVCAILKHDCKLSMSYIPQVAKGIRNSQEFQETVKNLDDLIVSFTKLEQEKLEFQNYLKAKQDESAKSIEKFYTDIARRIEALKEDSLAELRKIHEDIDNAIKDDIKKCRKANEEVQVMKEKMRVNSSVNESLLFVRMKYTDKSLTSVKEMSANLLAKPKTTPRFEQNRSLMDVVQSAAGIGKILTDSSKPSRITISQQESRTPDKSSPLTIPTHGPELAKMMYVGARVMRGRDWQWGNQDQPVGRGTVVDVKKTKGWMTVKWDGGSQYDYRMGTEDAYDLIFVPGTYKPPS